MLNIIDFRNGRYQGQTKDHLPHGLGCFLDRNFMFCVAEWIAGEIKGNAIIIYPSGSVFCGKISYRMIEGLCSFQLAEDHVKLMTFKKNKRQERDMEKLAAILPLMKIVLDIDNSKHDSARVLSQYDYSLKNEQQNISTITKILNLDRNNSQNVYTFRSFIHYFEENFYKNSPNIFEFMISDSKGKKQYFLGLKGDGLGIKIEPNQQINLSKKKTGRVYNIRGMGSFTRENQMKDIGMKMKDNSMKGVIYEEGCYSLPDTIITYQNGKRLINCSINFHNYIKRSLFYRDKILNIEFLYRFEDLLSGFNENLRKIETEKIAQFTIQNPNSQQPTFIQIEKRRKQKNIQLQYKAKQTILQPEVKNPYQPIGNRVANPQYNLKVAGDQIYRTANKRKNIQESVWEDYKRIEYRDPNYRKAERDYGFVAEREPQIRIQDSREENRRYASPRQSGVREDFFIYKNYDLEDNKKRKSPSKIEGWRIEEYKKYPDSLYPKRERSPKKYQDHQGIQEQQKLNNYGRNNRIY